MKKTLSITLLLLSFLCSGFTAKAQDLQSLASQYVSFDDSVRVHYKTVGKGPKTVLFVHGLGCDMNTWQAQYEAFRHQNDLRLVFIDLPGFGQSSKPHVDYTLDFFGRSIDAVLDAVKCDFTFLVGHSLGTPVCRQYLMQKPMRVAGMMDIDGVYCLYPQLSDDATDEQKAGAAAYEAAVQGFASSFDGVKQCKQTFTEFAASLAGPQTPAAVRKYASTIMPKTPEYVASSTMHHLIDRKWWMRFPLPFPVEVICTQNSGLEPDNRQQMQTFYSDMQYTELETCGHFIQMEQPELINNCLNRLLKAGVQNNLECFDAGIHELEDNYAGFRFKVTDRNRAEYQRIKQEYRDSIARGSLYGPIGVAEMCCYMQDFHLGCTFRMWSDRFPMKWANYRAEMQEYNPQPVAKPIDEHTFLLRFPTCAGDDDYVKWVYEAVDQYRRSSCDRLVLDIRGNGGGDDSQFMPILTLLFKQPGFTDGIMVRNTADIRSRYKDFVQDDPTWMERISQAEAHADEPYYQLFDDFYITQEEGIDPRRPVRTAVLIDRGVASSGEQLLLNIRACAPDVQFFGRDNTLGCIDISNVQSVSLPHTPNSIRIPTTVSARVLRGEYIDGIGIQPDVRIDLPLPETLTDNIDSWVLWAAQQLAK